MTEYSKNVCENYFDDHGGLTREGRKAFGIPTREVCEAQIKEGSIDSVVRVLSLGPTVPHDRQPIVAEDTISPLILHDAWAYMNW